MKSSTFSLVVAVLGLTVSLAVPSVYAEDSGAKKPHRGQGLFDQFDANKDGQLSKTEVPADKWDRLAKLDADNDGGVTREELVAGHKDSQGKGDGRFAKLDKDGDGKISKDEAGDKLAERFANVDKNSDGFLTKEELRAAGQQHFAQKDTDKDGKISKEEFGGNAERFAHVDKNGDGFLTREELQAAHAKHRRGGAEGGEAKPLRKGHRGEKAAEEKKAE